MDSFGHDENVSLGLFGDFGDASNPIDPLGHQKHTQIPGRSVKLRERDDSDGNGVRRWQSGCQLQLIGLEFQIESIAGIQIKLTQPFRHDGLETLDGEERRGTRLVEIRETGLTELSDGEETGTATDKLRLQLHSPREG